jgi:hypothetical protein
MSEITNMRRLLDNDGGSISSWSTADRDTLLSGHIETISRGYTRQLQMYEKMLQGFLETDQAPQERTGQAVLRSLSSVRRLSPVTADESIAAALTNCTILSPPQFNIQSAEQVADVRRFTRASASGKTLEVAAVTGEFGGVRYPSSETFILGLNRSQASIGGILTIPPHRDGAILTVNVQLAVENVLPPSHLLYTLRGYEDLPLRGTAVSWCTASLSLHGPQGSTTTPVEFVSSWANRDGMGGDDLLPSGVIPLNRTIGLQAATSTITVFVDATCFAAAEETQTPFESAFAQFECRNKPNDEIIGIYVPPSRLRVHQITVRLCQFPLPTL